MCRLSFPSKSLSQTDALGIAIGQSVSTGLTIALDGQLGSGKTHIVRAICAGLGVSEDVVNSPTFVLMQTYQGTTFPVCHFDTYRLGDVDEFLAIGAEDYVNSDQFVCLIEWAQLVQPVLPTDCLNISITQTGESERLFEFSAGGPISEAMVIQLKAKLPAE